MIIKIIFLKSSVIATRRVLKFSIVKDDTLMSGTNNDPCNGAECHKLVALSAELLQLLSIRKLLKEKWLALAASLR